MIIQPQPGPQYQFLSSQADLAIYGGAAGGGKSFAMLLEPLRHVHNPLFRGVIFRRTSPELFGEGGLWDESQHIYPAAGGKPNESKLRWKFPSGASISFSHMQYDKDRLAHQGRQYTYIAYDEFTHFTENQFWYLTSRNRSMAGIKPYQRASTNPDPDSFVRKLIDWWIDEQGFPIKQRSNKLRWFVRVDNELVFGDTPDEIKQYNIPPRSLTFIPARLSDNKILTDTDPNYRAALLSLPAVERDRLLHGNWNVRAAAGNVFKRHWFEVVDAVPGGLMYCRSWDRAASEPSASYPDPDWTAGVKLGFMPGSGTWFVTDVQRQRLTAGRVDTLIKNTATQDGGGCIVTVFQDPGQAGKAENESTVKMLNGFNVNTIPVQTTKGKVTFSMPVSSQAEAGNIKILRAPWNEQFINELEGFPDGKHDDQVDALSGAYHTLVNKTRTGVAKRVPRKSIQHAM